VDAELLGQGAGVDPGDGRDAALAEPLVERLRRGRVGRLFAELRDDVAGDVRPVRFETRGIDAVIADQRIGLAEDLAVVRGVGDALRVADDPGIENDFPPDLRAGAETYALADGPVGEGQNRFPDEPVLRFILGEYSTSPVPAQHS
jgi:hypothetical protein